MTPGYPLAITSLLTFALPFAATARAQASFDFALAERQSNGAAAVNVWSSFSATGAFTPAVTSAPSIGIVRAIDDTERLGRLFMLVEDPAFPGGTYILASVSNTFFAGPSPLPFPPPKRTLEIGDTWTDLKIDISIPGSPPSVIVVGHDSQLRPTVTRLRDGAAPIRRVIGTAPVTSAKVAIDQATGTIYVADDQARLHTVSGSLASWSSTPLIPAAVASDLAFSAAPATQNHPLILSERSPNGIHRYDTAGTRGISQLAVSAVSISVDHLGGFYAIADFGAPPPFSVLHFDHTLTATDPCLTAACVPPADYTALCWVSRAARDAAMSSANLLGAMTLAQPSYVGDPQLTFNVNTNTAGMLLGVATGFSLNQTFGLHLDTSMVTFPAPAGAPLLPMVLPLNLTAAFNGAGLHWQLIGLVGGQVQTSGMASHMVGYRPVE